METPQENSGGNKPTTPENSCNWLREFIKPVTEVMQPVCTFFIDNSQHMFNPGENVRRLDTGTKSLIGKKDDANREIETGRGNGLVETNEGRTWMERVDNAISDKERNHERYEQRRKIYGCYPNCWGNFKISKKAADTLDEVNWCYQNKPPLVDPLPQPVELIPVDNTISLKAEPCGFGVEGLGFYRIPYSGKQKGESESRIAWIKVTEGQMSAAQVTSELERLHKLSAPKNWKWNVEESGDDSFITTFPSKMDLERMILWGTVQANCSEAKMDVIEKKSESEECKYEIPKVWVQFHGLSEELMETPVIWAVGSILGVTCSVDMNFTNKHGRARLNVAVLNPDLIPDLVKVVVGDYVYKLKFRVENKEDADSPKLIDMDTEPQEDGDEDPPSRTSKWRALLSDQDTLEQAIKAEGTSQP